ncbi:nucleotide pyrophosphohydrolase [Oleiharenicola lentus]|uniref:Nucleotide pyrophosphohydrolase n=1 Tax=Oleiharenicola lentus TaxID=2508720 RepID=A0A4Q1C5M4_9BACT|nr:nucleotide pyrophosphohydrolase [Oleiharenicola lentus]RXK53655.1 nucleotide pyrophosphohydrolase [Oleiharenicola lentus]
MTDDITTLAQLKEATAKFARERDWEQFHAPKNLSMAIAAEVGELMEHFLWVSADESSTLCLNKDKRGKIEEELADIIMFSLQFANMAKIDVASAISAKIVKNAAKYPVSKAKGRSEKYTEL